MAITATGRPGIDGDVSLFQGQTVKAHFLDFSCCDGVAATAGGGQANGFSLADYQITRFITVATAADSATLPPARAGRMRIVINAAAANAMNVFPASGQIINALTADTALSVAANKTIIFWCAVDGVWNSLLSA